MQCCQRLVGALVLEKVLYVGQFGPNGKGSRSVYKAVR